VNKKNQKNFKCWARGVAADTAHAPDSKSLFGSFSSEKELLAFNPAK
jgi:hypothetical protein